MHYGTYWYSNELEAIIVIHVSVLTGIVVSLEDITAIRVTVLIGIVVSWKPLLSYALRYLLV